MDVVQWGPPVTKFKCEHRKRHTTCIFCTRLTRPTWTRWRQSLRRWASWTSSSNRLTNNYYNESRVGAPWTQDSVWWWYQKWAQKSLTHLISYYTQVDPDSCVLPFPNYRSKPPIPRCKPPPPPALFWALPLPPNLFCSLFILLLPFGPPSLCVLRQLQPFPNSPHPLRGFVYSPFSCCFVHFFWIMLWLDLLFRIVPFCKPFAKMFNNHVTTTGDPASCFRNWCLVSCQF